MAIEKYLYAGDPFRSTSIPDPLPYPIKTAPSSDQSILKLKPKILDLLASHGFRADPQIVVEDITKPHYPHASTPIATLRVLYHTEQRTLGDFSAAKDSVRDLLIREGHQSVQVEIVHRDLCFQPSFFPVQPSDMAALAYEKTKSKLLGLVNRNLGSAWAVLGLFRVGRTEENGAPTIVVLVRPYVAHNWTDLMQAILEIVREHVDVDDINVEFLPGILTEGTGPLSGEEQPGVPQLATMTAHGDVGMGFSIGVCGGRGSGTAGGFVTLTQGDITRKGILTNYNVVSPPESSSPAAVIQKANAFGSSLFKPDDTRVELQYFAGKDLDASQQHLRDIIGSSQQNLAQHSESQEQNLMIKGEPSRRLEALISYAEKMIEEHQAKQLVVDRMPRRLGKVGVSSGRLLWQDRIHDWALVELSDETAANIFRPNYMPDVPRTHQPSEYGITPDIPTLPVVLDAFGQLHGGEYYLKQGRSTGITSGVSNGVLTYCNWSARDRGRYDDHGQPAQVQASRTEASCTEEFVIFSKKAMSQAHTQSTFMAPGDSGSFVVNQHGEVCGLLYGGVTGLCGPPDEETYYANAGLAMSISDVKKSVALRTKSIDSDGNETCAALELPA
ncbi:hypothetical protein PHISP_01818 [Aspergillus sp. HF37]|nr:hypothetical protein PHISP_01818 [Aspergillus sp. HF37]